jgi:hypothetical protein
LSKTDPLDLQDLTLSTSRRFVQDQVIDCGTFLLHMVTPDTRFVVNEAVITPIVERGYL